MAKTPKPHQDLDDKGEDPVPFTVVRVSSSVSQVRPEVNVLKDKKKSSKKQPQTTTTTAVTTTTTEKSVFNFTFRSRPESENRFRDARKS